MLHFLRNERSLKITCHYSALKRMSDQAKVKYARKTEAFFRETWRQLMCGYTTTMIAEHLSTSVPTVRRTLMKIRRSGLERGSSGSVTDPLYAAAAKHKIPNFLSWDHYIAVIRRFYHGDQPVNYSDLHRCMVECPVRLTPRRFVNKYVAYRPIHGNSYTINLIDFRNAEQLSAERQKHLKCRYCPLKKYKASIFSIFESDSYLFLTLMFTLSRYRFRDMDEFELMIVYMEAAVIGMIHEVVLTHAEKLAYEGMPEDQVTNEAEDYFIKLTDEVFDQILIGL